MKLSICEINCTDNILGDGGQVILCGQRMKELEEHFVFLSSGLLMSITLPCYDETGNFIGVAGTDINLEDLLSDITLFNQDQTTYAFMIAKTGRTLIHPLLPAPSEAYDDPFFIDIRTLETDSKFLEVFASMTRYAFTCISYS